MFRNTRIYDTRTDTDCCGSIRREGVGSKELDSTAYEVARANEIIATFDRMIVDEIQIDRYL